MSYSSISQTITRNRFSETFKEADSAFVVLTEHQARSVVKDLVRGDAAQAELKLTREALNASQQQNDLLRQDLQDKEDISANLETASKELEKIIAAQDTEIIQCQKATLPWKLVAIGAVLGGILIATQ